MPSTIAVTDSTRIRQSDSQVSCRVDEEEILMSIENGEYYSLNPVATEIWQQIADSSSVSEIVNQQLRSYAVDESVCRSDVLHLINELRSEGLVEVVND